jgi:hypothetical protein
VRLLDVFEVIKVRWRQRRLVRDIERSPIRYSDGTGASLEDPIVITGAAHDILGTAAILSWLIRQHGTMNVDWRMRIKSGHHDGERHIDIYVIQLRSGEERTYFFDISESWGKWPNLDSA